MSEKEMSREQVRETAKGLFVKSDMSQKEIAVPAWPARPVRPMRWV